MLGDHIRALKGGTWVHGIDLGDQRVLHLAEEPGLAPGDRLRRVYKPEFTAGASRVELVVHRERTYPARAVVARAWSRFMDPSVVAMFRDSEAFAAWCKIGRLPEAGAANGAAVEAAPPAPAPAARPAPRAAPKPASTAARAAPARAAAPKKAAKKKAAPRKAAAAKAGKGAPKAKARAKPAPRTPARKAATKARPARKAAPGRPARKKATAPPGRRRRR